MTAACSLAGSGQSNSAATAFTFTALSLGTAASDRIIFVAVTAGLSSSTIPTVSSLTVAGISASSVIQLTHTSLGFGLRTAFYSASVPTGTTGDVVVTFSASMDRCQVTLFAATGISTTASATASNSADPCVASINVPAGGLLIATSGDANSSGTPTCTWTNVTERYDTNISGSTTSASGAFDVFATAQTALSITADWTATSIIAAGVWASFAPAATTVNLVGVSTSMAAGTLTPSVSRAITGVATTTAVGTLSPTVAPTLTGVQTTTAIGTLGIQALKTLTGVATTMGVGSITPTALVSLLGVQTTMAVGALLADTAQRINLVGVQTTMSVGTLAVAAQIQLAGVSTTVDVGQLAWEIALALEGVAAEMGLGDITITDNWTRLGTAGGTWTPVSGNPTTWTPVSGSSTTWTPVSPTSTVWTPVSSTPTTWTPQ